MTRRKAKAAVSPYTWVRVRRHMFCWLGSHAVLEGAWVRYRKDASGFASCETCLRDHGIARPERTGAIPDASKDARTRQGGDDE